MMECLFSSLIIGVFSTLTISYYQIVQVAPTLVPLLKFYFHEEVRKAAISGIYLI